MTFMIVEIMFISLTLKMLGLLGFNSKVAYLVQNTVVWCPLFK